VLVRRKASADLTTYLSQRGSSVLGSVRGTGWVRVRVPSGKGAAEFVATLKASDLVADAATDVFYAPPTGEASTMPLGGIHLRITLPDQGELLRIGADDARLRATGDGTRVAVVDTGILPDADGMEDNVDGDGWDTLNDDDDPTDATNGVDDDGDGYVDECYSHGAFVASLILAVAPDARIVPFRALNADGVGTSASVASAIHMAVTAGVDAINLSVSVAPGDVVVKDAILLALSEGVQVVASAGNGGGQTATLHESIEDVLLVTSVDSTDTRADFAAYGGSVDLAAPGVDMEGVYPGDPGTAIWSGTSFSAAVATGGYLLLRELNPTWDPEDVVEQLLSTSASIDDQNEGFEGLLGAGRLDLDAATQP
jgi:hypothetical protein